MPHSTRNQLVVEHLDLAQYLAQTLHRTLPEHVDVEELEADAYLGLLKAAEHFDPNRNVQFRTYAAKRIHGAMLDGVRERRQSRRRHACPRMQSLDCPLSSEDGQTLCLADLIPAREPPVSQALERREDLVLLLRWLDGAKRTPIAEAQLEKLNLQELAARTGLTRAGILQRIARLGALVRQVGIAGD